MQTHIPQGVAEGEKENVKYKRQDAGQDRNDSIIFCFCDHQMNLQTP